MPKTPEHSDIGGESLEERIQEEERLKGGPYGGPYPKKFITPENIPQDSRDEVLDWLATEKGEEDLKKYLAVLDEEKIRSLDDGDIEDLIEFVEFCKLEPETEKDEKQRKDDPVIQNIKKLREEFERREQIKELAKKTPPPGNLPTVKDKGANPLAYSTGWSEKTKEASRKSAFREKPTHRPRSSEEVTAEKTAALLESLRKKGKAPK